MKPGSLGNCSVSSFAEGALTSFESTGTAAGGSGLFADGHGHPTMRLTYETLTRDPQASVGRIARHFGIELPGSVRPAEVTVRIQRDTVSDGWRTRFLDEYGDRDVLEMN